MDNKDQVKSISIAIGVALFFSVVYYIVVNRILYFLDHTKAIVLVNDFVGAYAIPGIILGLCAVFTWIWICDKLNLK